jgi:hypothetical protein
MPLHSTGRSFDSMACFSPLQAFQSLKLKSNGKSLIVFKRPSDRFNFVEVQLPCSQCIGCRLSRSRQWAIRLVHEASLYDNSIRNSFITLTYRDEFLPRGGTLVVSHFQDFMKRLRRRLTDPDSKYFISSDYKIRFFHCGEYGSQFGRPHYHAIIFNYDFPDKYEWSKSNANTLYRSDFLDELWPFGFTSIGSVTFESAAYVARYCLKKVTGDAALDYYLSCDSNGELLSVKPEYTTMSRRPGIAKGWLDKYMSDVYPKDHIVMNGFEQRPPRFYDTQYELGNAVDFARIKSERKADALKRSYDNTPERLAVRKILTDIRIDNLLPRFVDSNSAFDFASDFMVRSASLSKQASKQ